MWKEEGDYNILYSVWFYLYEVWGKLGLIYFYKSSYFGILCN